MPETTTFEEQLNATGRLVYTNKGVSMLPLLREDRDIMIFEKLSGKDACLYDAVLFVRPYITGRGHYVVHRILKRNPDGSFWIVGDNCTSGEMVGEDQIIGRLISVIRDGKQVDFKSIPYRLYVNLWCRPYHMRFIILKGKRFIRRCLGFVKRRLIKKTRQL